MNPSNVVILRGGIVRDPEIVQGKVVKLSIALDFSGTDKKNPDNKSGYFDLTYFLTGGNERNAKFVQGQIENGNMKKGSQVEIVGSLRHERWEDENGNTRSRVSVVVDQLDYAKGGARPEGEATSSNDAGSPGEAAAIGEF